MHFDPVDQTILIGVF